MQVTDEGLIEKPLQFDNNDPSTFPKNQILNINKYNAAITAASNPKGNSDKILRDKIKQTLFKEYNKNKKNLNADELKIIKKHPSQIELIEPVAVSYVRQNFKPINDPYTQLLEQRFNRMLNEQEKAKQDRDQGGLAGILGGFNEK